MKKITLLLLLISTAAVAQQKKSFKNLVNSANTDVLRESQTTVYKPGKTIYYSWDSASLVWMYSDSTRTFYNAMANPTNSLRYYDPSGMSKDTSIYDNQGLLTTQYGFYWDGSIWDTSYILTITYNMQANKLSEQFIFYSAGNIAGGFLDTYTYTGNQMTSNISLDWDNGSWVNSYKGSLFYNGNGELDKFVNYEWDNINNVWEKTDSITNIMFDYWSGDLQTSRPSVYMTSAENGDNFLDSVFYDSQNNQIKDVMYVLQGTVWVYESMQTDSYIYDSNNSITEHTILQYESGETTIFSRGDKYEYSDFKPYTGSGLEIQENSRLNNLNVYPNPNNGTFALNGDFDPSATIEVYTISGKKVFSAKAEELNASKEIALPGVSKGIYFVRLYDAAKVLTEKIVVQ